MNSTSTNSQTHSQQWNETALSNKDQLPLTALLALAMAAFITILTEALPAGLLPQMSQSLEVSEALVGQLITIYAIGSVIAAIPVTMTTQSWRRRPLLLIAISGFVVVNTVTALSDSYAVTLVARFFAGVFAGLLWALAAGYAARLVPDHLKGRAIAIAMSGAAIAFSIGLPVGTFLGTIFGWRVSFALMSTMCVILIFLVIAKVPDFPGQPRGQRFTLWEVFTMPGIRSILFTILTYMLAHNVLYTYIAPFLVLAGIESRIDLILLVYGLAALLGMWIVGIFIDRWLRELVLVSIAVFVICVLALGIAGTIPIVVYVCFAVWGLVYGGIGTLFQTALAKTAGEATDVAQSILVTIWSIGIAGGAVVGGMMLATIGVSDFYLVMLILLVIALAIVWAASSHGFTSSKREL